MKYEDFKQTDLYLGPFMFFHKGAIKLMLAVLLPNEKIKLVAGCNLENTAGVVTLTDKRIFFTSKILFTSIKKDVLLKDVTSICFTSAIFNKLTISSYGRDVLVIAIRKSNGEQFIQTYNLLKQAEGMRAESSVLGLSDLEQLADLRDKGIISADEFEQTKRKILGI